MQVGMCQECNSRYSKDEEYFAAFLASVICGSTKPDSLQFPKAFRILAHNPRLRSRIDASRHVENIPGKGTVIIWIPELERIERVIVKNARGHMLHDHAQDIEDPPTHVNILPLDLLCLQSSWVISNTLKESERSRSWDRLMLRLLDTGEVGKEGWIEVQQGIYRYAVDDYPRVHIVLREYLAAEVVWGE